MQNLEKTMRGIITHNPELYKEAIDFSLDLCKPSTIAFIDIAATELVEQLEKMSKSDTGDINQIDTLIYHLSVFTAVHVNERKAMM